MSTWTMVAGALQSILSLGRARLVALGVIGFGLATIVGTAGYLLSRPTWEMLYSGLDRQDMSRVSSTLSDLGFAFDASSEGSTIYVGAGRAAEARMALAEHGLPQGSSGGYELFDKLGPFGLTSFMQGVTRVRVLEGELARTIQMMRGISAARVHIALGEEGSFRKAAVSPAASVVIRSDGVEVSTQAQAVRRLVSAAVPGLPLDKVTVMSASGILLAGSDDGGDGTAVQAIALERQVSGDIRERIRSALAPHVGARNVEVSVAARLNMDRRHVSEMVYNPDGRVERSVKIVRQTQSARNTGANGATGVERNLPQPATPTPANQTSDDNQRREETTGYEISSKSVDTRNNGYDLERLSIAVLINRASLQVDASPTPAQTPEQRLDDIRTIVLSASGASRERGDVVSVTAVTFTTDGADLQPQAPASLSDLLLRQAGTWLNALTALVIVLLVFGFGIRPALKSLAGRESASVAPALASLPNSAGVPVAGMLPAADAAVPDQWREAAMIGDIESRRRNSPQRKLEQLVAYDAAQAAAILKQWMHQGDRA